MGLEQMALARTDDLPIRHEGGVHNGKVRSVYWLTPEDSRRITKERDYAVPTDTRLGVRVMSDRISAFDCNWKGTEGLDGVPFRGAALNAICEHWFKLFTQKGIARNHILETPHPLAWIVERARPVMVEAIARQYITGSMWRAYNQGEREFCGIKLPEGLQANQKLQQLLVTPSTKGTVRGILGIPEEDDTQLTRQQITDNLYALGFRRIEDVLLYELLLKSGFRVISTELEKKGQIFVDTKFEFGYDANGRLMFIDEVGTPDSSRMWDASEYAQGRIVENSKEGFRQFLLAALDKDVLLNGSRMKERKELAAAHRIPAQQMMAVTATYKNIAEQITGKELPKVERPREGIIEALAGYSIIK